MGECIFCKIIDKEIPSTIVYENDKVLAFKDIHPVAPVHILIVPKMHVSDLNSLDENNLGIIIDVHEAAKKIAEQLGIAKKGYRLIANCGVDAGQTVFHIHYHLIGGKRLGDKII